MRRGTLLLVLVLTLVFLSWMFPAWLPEGGFAAIPYYTETATKIYKLQDEFLVGFYDSFLKQPYVWLLEHIWMVAGGYALVSLFLIVISKDRSGGWGNLWFLCVATLVLIVWFFGGTWLSVACASISDAYQHPFNQSVGSWLIALTTGLLGLLLILALALTFWVGIPIYVLVVLLLLPGALYALFRLAVVLPFLLWHYLHYLFVPHPAETAYKVGMTRQVPIPELATTVANVIYQFDLKDYDRLPKAWKSKNWQRRLDAFQGRLEAEDRFMEELIKNLQLKTQFHE